MENTAMVFSPPAKTCLPWKTGLGPCLEMIQSRGISGKGYRLVWPVGLKTWVVEQDQNRKLANDNYR
jgi:hypothetical protein